MSFCYTLEKITENNGILFLQKAVTSCSYPAMCFWYLQLYYYKKGGHYYAESKNIAGQVWHLGFITGSNSGACSYIMECEYMLLVYTGTGKTARQCKRKLRRF